MDAEWGEATPTVKPRGGGEDDWQQLRQMLHSANETLMSRLGTSNDGGEHSRRVATIQNYCPGVTVILPGGD